MAILRPVQNVNSSEHSVKGYANDVTLIYNNFDACVSVLQSVDQRAHDLGLSFKACEVHIIPI